MDRFSDRTIGRIAKDLQLYLQGCTKALFLAQLLLRREIDTLSVATDVKL